MSPGAVAARWVEATVGALTPLADPVHAAGARAYMKDVAPFLGIYAKDRRAAQRAAWKPLPRLDADEVADVARLLWELPEREFAHAACDLLAGRQADLPATSAADLLAPLVVTKPWWDTVDGLGATITPVVFRNPELVGLMWEWLRSGDRWLTRAAVGHQRGLKQRTDLPRLYAMCAEVSADREFFVAKAVGWALRDAAALDPAGTQRFVDDHPLPAVARREAVRGLARASSHTQSRRC